MIGTRVQNFYRVSISKETLIFDLKKRKKKEKQLYSSQTEKTGAQQT